MVVVAISLKDNDHRIETEMTRDELAAIGHVTVLWAELEHALYWLGCALSKKLDIPLPTEIEALSFKKRIRATRILLKKAPISAPVKETLLKTLNSISGIERSRHRITHGLWDWEMRDPIATIASSSRHPHAFSEPFNFKKLIGLAKSVGRLTFILMYPGGPQQYEEEQAVEFAQSNSYVSRHLALMLSGIDINSPHPFRDTPQSRKRTRPPTR